MSLRTSNSESTIKPPRCLRDTDVFKESPLCGRCDYFDKCQDNFREWLRSSNLEAKNNQKLPEKPETFLSFTQQVARTAFIDYFAPVIWVKRKVSNLWKQSKKG